jgi:predicted ester cyclase
MPDRQIIHEDITAEGDKVLIRWTRTGTPKVKALDINPNDKQITLTGFDLSYFGLQDCRNMAAVWLW